MVSPVNMMVSGIAATEPGNKSASRATPDIAGAKGEIRRLEIKDGNLTVKVYDSNGKLLRMTPPGYLPAGEQKFDVTI
jgi:hypothetical protein